MINQTTDNQEDKVTYSHLYVNKKHKFFSIAAYNNKMLLVSSKRLYNNKMLLISFKRQTKNQDSKCPFQWPHSMFGLPHDMSALLFGDKQNKKICHWNLNKRDWLHKLQNSKL